MADRNDQLLSLSASPPGTPTPPTVPTPPTPPTVPTSPVATTTTLTASAVSHHGSRPPTATLTVTVTPGSGSAVPGGWVELIYNGTVLGAARVRVVNGVATATFNVAFFGTGDFTFSAQYLGSSQFGGSSSSSVTVTV